MVSVKALFKEKYGVRDTSPLESLLQNSEPYEFDKSVNILGSKFEQNSSMNMFSKKSSKVNQNELGNLIVKKATLEKRPESGSTKMYQSVPNLKYT